MAGWSSEEFSLLLSSFCFTFPPLPRKICLQVICEILLLLAKAEADLAAGPWKYEVSRNQCGASALLELPPLFTIPTWMDVQNKDGWAVSSPRNLAVYKTSKIEKQTNKPTTANRKQVTIKTKEVFVPALNYFSDPVCNSIVWGQLSCKWGQENQEQP